MPYEGEFAKYRSIRRLVESGRVKELQQRMRIRDTSQDKTALPKIQLSDVRPSEWRPELVLAIDGSHQEHKIENGYPGAEMGYVTVASVLMDVAKIRQLDTQRPVDPKTFRTTEQVQSIDCAFPGCNIILDDEKSPQDSLRKALFETFSQTRIFSDGESLLDTYEALLGYRDLLEKPEYSTDTLRIHEGMVPDSSNGAMFAEIMQVLELLLMIHVLRWLEQKQLLWLLRHMAIVLDGPLAIFGYPAGLLLPLEQEINRINWAARPFTNGCDLLLVGVEKKGIFVNHFANIDENKDGSSGAFPLQTAALLTDEYIKKNIVFSDSQKPYGSQTYFGRKYFYKTRSGARIVASTPFLHENHKDTSQAVPDQYPRLAEALGLLDQLASSRYPDSLSPLISAHAEAAIPMNLGSRVLEEMAKKLIKKKR